MLLVHLHFACFVINVLLCVEQLHANSFERRRQREREREMEREREFYKTLIIYLRTDLE